MSDLELDSHVGVVIPIRSLTSGKLRLRGHLTAAERSKLITSMAEAVVKAAMGMPVLVVHDDELVAPWAESLGAECLAGVRPGLNHAAAEGRNALIAQGFDRVIVAHADIPRASDLRPVADFDGITLVPDRVGDGTNVMCLPSDVDFDFAYGPGSFDTHLHMAKASGVAVRVLDDPDLAWDIDHPDDLDLFDSHLE